MNFRGMICDAKGFRSKNWKYFNKFWIDTVHYSSKKGIMYKGTNSQPLFYFLRFQSPKSVRIQTISFHNKVFLRISKLKISWLIPSPRPAFPILTLWCYKIASSSQWDPIMSQYNEASVQVHCSPLFGVSLGLCWRLSA